MTGVDDLARGYQSDAASTEEARARQREQLAAMKAAAAPDVKRKRRVLKRLSKEPSATPEMSDMAGKLTDVPRN